MAVFSEGGTLLDVPHWSFAIMKNLKIRVAFLTLLSFAGSLAALAPCDVTLVDAAQGENGVEVIHVSRLERDSTSSTEYTLACNVDIKTCVIPDKDETYTLQDSPNEIYECAQNVALFRSEDVVGIYCLQAVSRAE